MRCCCALAAPPRVDIACRSTHPTSFATPQAAAEAAHEEGALAALLLGVGRAAWLAGFILVPAAFFWAGTAAWDALHGAYLLLVAGLLLRHTLRLQPRVCVSDTVAVIMCSGWRLAPGARGYSCAGDTLPLSCILLARPGA